MDKTINLYSLSLRDYKSYIYAAAFVIGNILLPQLCHLIPNGGLTILPIYFFTLIAAYKYGWRVGLMCGILSPIVNHLLFGMPGTAVLPIILIKSTLLVAAASFVAHKTQKVSIALLARVVFFYQIVGSLIEWAMVQDFYVAMQDFRMGILGMHIQFIGGYFLLRVWKK